ncbi:hypothetical protein BH09DEP1_BH09DEP1_3040 [soil metagenome]
MNKPLFFRYLLLIGCLSQISSVFAARDYDDCCQPACCEQVYDCGDPLNCGSVNFWFRAGVAPTVWRDRSDFSLVSCNALSIPNNNSNIVPVFELPKFKSFFKTPWIIGGQIGYAVTDCLEFYLEANFRKASHRRFLLDGGVDENGNIIGITIPNDRVTVLLNFHDGYRATDFYVGARYYWGRYWCDRIAFFLGGQFGLVHRQAVDFDFVVTSTQCSIGSALTGSSEFFERSNSPAAGVNFGLDWCMGCGWSFMILAEVIATCGPKSNDNILITSNCSQLPALLPSNIIIGHIGTEIFFPVTFGFKYSF